MPWALSRVTRGVLAGAALLLSTAGRLGAQAVPETGTIRGRVVDAATERPVADAQVTISGTSVGALTNATGNFVITNVPSGKREVAVRRLGYQRVTQLVECAAGTTVTANFSLTAAASQMDAVVITALGQQSERRAIGSAQQTVGGADIAATQRPNFVNALQGRVAGVEVTSTSGVPGSSSSVTIRGISSISGSNQPLFIVDGLPLDNKTTNTGVLASGAGSATSFENRGIDFTNRAADLNPEDIESLVVLKGPEASALYGIDAANGAIVITTKRGRPGAGTFDYTNTFSYAATRARPQLQKVYSPNGVGSATFLYFGLPYADTTRFYDNIDGFFQPAMSQKHQLSFSGGAPDNRVNYRLSTGFQQSQGVVPNSYDRKLNLTGASVAQIKDWMRADLTMAYSNQLNEQPFKGAGGPLVGLLVWPQHDDAKDYLTPAGTRRRLTNLSLASEIDNPYFNIEKNNNTSANNRLIANLQLTFTPFSWGRFSSQLGRDAYTNQLTIVRHPESTWGASQNGIIDVADDISRTITSNNLLAVNPIDLGKGLTLKGLVANSVQDYKMNVDGLYGENFLDPNFVSVNNTDPQRRRARTVVSQRRLISASARAELDYNRYLTLTIDGHNDWTSTIPRERNSFFYSAFSSAFVFTDAFPSLKSVFSSGKLRAAMGSAGKDARPYAYRPSLESKSTSNGGYGYGFTGPNLNLKPEFTHSREVGAELGFLDERLLVDVAYYRKQTKDQIVNDIRGSYATGFILFNLNGAETRNTGLELMVRGTPILRPNFTWDVTGNFERARGKVLKLPNELPESYISDTWLFGNVRAGTKPGLSTRSLTGYYYMRNKDCQILVDPTTGLPIRNTTVFVDAKCVNTKGETVVEGYDRQPDFSLGVENSFRLKRVSLKVLLDIRKGGDILNGTEQYLTARGLTERTLDRFKPVVVDGVLRDGKENSDNPTPNSIVVVPGVNTTYYTNISEELFIERDINWLRVRDVTLNIELPPRIARRASVFIQGTDLFLLTNYTGLDPVVNGNSAAVGGSGAQGIDFGNFPMPRGMSVGVRLGF